MKTKLNKSMLLAVILMGVAPVAHAETLAEIGSELASIGLFAATTGPQWLYIAAAGSVSEVTGDQADALTNGGSDAVSAASGSKQQKVLLNVAAQDAAGYLATDGQAQSELLILCFEGMRRELRDHHPTINEAQVTDQELARAILGAI